MIKRIPPVIIALLLIFSSFITVSANEIPKERQLPLVVDNGELLLPDEEKSLLSRLENLSNKLKCEIAVITVKSLEGKNAQKYADDFYDYNGYGYGENDDGIILLISVSARKWAISTHGLAHKKLSVSDLDEIEDELVPLLNEGRYYDAFISFADNCYYYISPQWKTILLVSLVIGLILGFVVVSVMKGSLQSVRAKYQAMDYVKKDSLLITNSQDIFLYRTISRRARPKNNSSGGSHRSSSGRSHGGRSGSF